MAVNNAHVIKWIRWQHWLAERQHRFLAMFYWSVSYDQEIAYGGGHASTEQHAP